MVVVRVVGSWPRSIVFEMKSNQGKTPGISSRIHHRNQLTVKAWQEAVKKKTIRNTTPTCKIRASVVAVLILDKAQTRAIYQIPTPGLQSSTQSTPGRRKNVYIHACG